MPTRGGQPAVLPLRSSCNSSVAASPTSPPCAAPQTSAPRRRHCSKAHPIQVAEAERVLCTGGPALRLAERTLPPGRYLSSENMTRKPSWLTACPCSASPKPSLGSVVVPNVAEAACAQKVAWRNCASGLAGLRRAHTMERLRARATTASHKTRSREARAVSTSTPCIRSN